MMAPTLVRFAPLVGLFLVPCGASLARADSGETRPVRVEVHGPESCSDADRLFAEVRARTEKARRSFPPEVADLTLVVSIKEGAGRVGALDGELTVRTPQGATSRRRLYGESCEALVSGLGLVAALAIDPMASTRAVSLPVLPAGPVPPPPDPPRTPEMPAHPAVRPLDVEVEEGVGLPPQTIVRWRATVGLHVGFFGAGGPGLVGEGDVYGELARESPGLLAPSLRLSLHRTLTVNQSPAGSAGESGALAWTYARAEGCPLRVPLVSAVALRVCAFFDGGALSANGQGVNLPESPVRPWLMPGALGRIEWLLALPDRWGILLDVEGGAGFPLVRQTFSFQPETEASTVYEAPAAVGVARVGAGVRFP